jgi:hypothetical protein
VTIKANHAIDLINKVTKKWDRQKRSEIRRPVARTTRASSLYRSISVRAADVAPLILPKAYAKASDNGRLPVPIRQFYYAARQEFMEKTGKPITYETFCLNVRKYEAARPSTKWRVLYDDRGHLVEPHTKKVVPLGTLAVDRYLRDADANEHRWLDLPDTQHALTLSTVGPRNRCSAALFVEKEGFAELLREAKLAERFDLLVISTKGQSNVATRRLVDELCAVGRALPLFVLHDLDAAGLLIAQTLVEVTEAAELRDDSGGDPVRYRFQHEINVIDLGLRLDDVKKWNLAAEDCAPPPALPEDSWATPEEREFLNSGRRVELNEFMPADFLRFIEEKLVAQGIQKIVPDASDLEEAYRRAYHLEFVNQRVEKLHEQASEAAAAAELPPDLQQEVRKLLTDDPTIPWDEAVAQIVENALDNGLE